LLPPWLSPVPGWWYISCQTGDLTAPAFLGQKREDRQPDPRFYAKNAKIAKIVKRHPRFWAKNVKIAKIANFFTWRS